MVKDGERNGDRWMAIALACASAATTLVQNARVLILWDLSYILENATRIAAGDVPYRDFPFPYAPLTFVMQAAIIRIVGRALWHHVAYAALGCGAATWVTYRLVRRIARPLHAALLTAPLAILGIYCIVPHPFYDPDCCLSLVLLAGWMVRLDARGWPRGESFAAGAAALLPLFIKQNIGLAFAGVVAVSALMLFVTERRRGLLFVIGGMAGGGVVAIAIVQLTCGVSNYVQWTIRFAASRRLPPLAQQLAIYDDSDLWWWLACVAIGLVVMRFHRVTGSLIASIPMLWSLVRFVICDDPLEPQINLLRLWPLALALAPLAMLRLRGFARWMPLILAGAIHGTFLSQSTWGSTYGIWPLLVLLVAYELHALGGNTILALSFTAAVLLGGAHYIANNERLTYAKVEERMQPEFAELVAWTDAHIPREDAILSLPGEDLFYFTTGRRPRFPVLMFDRTVNPYDAATLVRLVDERNVRWLILKKRLQLNGTPMPEMGEVCARLAPRLHPVANLKNYEVLEVWRATPRPSSGPGQRGMLRVP